MTRDQLSNLVDELTTHLENQKVDVNKYLNMPIKEWKNITKEDHDSMRKLKAALDILFY